MKKGDECCKKRANICLLYFQCNFFILFYFPSLPFNSLIFCCFLTRSTFLLFFLFSHYLTRGWAKRPTGSFKSFLLFAEQKSTKPPPAIFSSLPLLFLCWPRSRIKTRAIWAEWRAQFEKCFLLPDKKRKEAT